MAFFAREDKMRKESPRRRGKHVGAAVEVPPPKPMMTREELRAQDIAAMNKGSEGQAGGVLRFVGDTEHRGVKTRNPNHKPDSDIFGPPVAQPSPRPRVRPGVTDEELTKIWAEDERKAAAAKRMEAAPTMVDRMLAEPVNPVMANARPKDFQGLPKKQIDLMTQTTEERNRQANEPAGFAGMGRQSRPAAHQGRSCKPVEQFAAPELMKRDRVAGRRTKFPPDTFSFQDEAQTAL